MTLRAARRRERPDREPYPVLAADVELRLCERGAHAGGLTGLDDRVELARGVGAVDVRLERRGIGGSAVIEGAEANDDVDKWMGARGAVRARRDDVHQVLGVYARRAGDGRE